MKNLIIIIAAVFLSYTANSAEGKQHHAAIFLGSTSNINVGHTGFTAGLDYQFFPGGTEPKVGVGLNAETVLMETTEYIVGFPISVHPIAGFKAYLQPSLFIASHDEAHIDTHVDEHSTEYVDTNISPPSDLRFMLRFGVGYDYHLHGTSYSISPLFACDLLGSQVSLVAGISFGLSF